MDRTTAERLRRCHRAPAREPWFGGASPVVFPRRSKLLVMSVSTDGDKGKGMTLAFELAAFRRFADPNGVLVDAGEWSRYVGLVANDTDAVASYVRAHDLRQDFELGDRDKWLALADLRAATDTDRHVFVGTSADDRRAAEGTGWEFVPVTEAAQKAGWELAERTEPGVLDRLRDRLAGGLPWR